MRKRVLSVLMTLCMVLTLLPVSALAALLNKLMRITMEAEGHFMRVRAAVLLPSAVPFRSEIEPWFWTAAQRTKLI